MTTAKKLMMTGNKWDSLEVGSFVEGGYYAGKIKIDGSAYALIVSPKGQAGPFMWNSNPNYYSTVTSVNDGKANTDAMMAISPSLFQAAAFCAGLNINGFTDWYLPARDELEICYRSFKPTTANNNTSYGANTNAIPPTGNYTSGNPAQTNVSVFLSNQAFPANNLWSSTVATNTTAYYQLFTDGAQFDGNQDLALYARAIRRVAI